MKDRNRPVKAGTKLNMPDSNIGLREEEVQRRIAMGLHNADAEVRAKSIPRIVWENLFTLFNLLCGVLGVLVLLSGPKQNAMFLGVVFINLFVGVLQQIRAKFAVEKTLPACPNENKRIKRRLGSEKFR